MNCLNSMCYHNKSEKCTNPRVIYQNVKCEEIEVEMDCLACNLNEANKCADCCRDWDEEYDD